MKPPIIIIGMHRSGTALLVQILQKLEVFVGHKLQEDSESIFFNKLNRLIFSKYGLDWDYPKSLYQIYPNSKKSKKLKRKLNSKLHSKEFKEYIGPSKYEKYPNPFEIDFLWCWKDPRNTYTLPVWLDFFNEAKIIHIYRHGVDIAVSLRNRLIKAKKDKFHLQILKFLKARFSGKYIRSLRFRLKFIGKKQIVYHLEGGLKLWDQYMVEARRAKKYTQSILEIKYEGLLEEPESIIKEIANFIGINVQEEQIKEIKKIIDPSRKYAYKSSQEYVEFAEKNKKLLKKYGYSA